MWVAVFLWSCTCCHHDVYPSGLVDDYRSTAVEMGKNTVIGFKIEYCGIMNGHDTKYFSQIPVYMITHENKYVYIYSTLISISIYDITI